MCEVVREVAREVIDLYADSEHEEEDVEAILPPAELPPDPTRGPQTMGRRPHHMHEIDDPVPTPSWLLLLLLLLLGLAGGETDQGKKALDDLSRDELAWSLSGYSFPTFTPSASSSSSSLLPVANFTHGGVLLTGGTG